ncbi:MAG: methionine--tRNA ligase subunit beta [Nanoarchaeota archaeon]
MKEPINFEDFSKLDLRVATIKDVGEIEGADKLFKLTLDVGDLGERIVCAGIKQNYDKKSLIGKQVILLANLQPRTLKGITSEGMILAASNEEHSEVILLKPGKKAGEGWRVS